MSVDPSRATVHGGPWRTAMSIAGIYLGFGLAWLLLGEWIVVQLGPRLTMQAAWEAYHEWVFLLLSAALLSVLLWLGCTRWCAASGFWHTIVEQARQGFWLIDDHARTLAVNPALAEMLGYAPDEMIGHKPFDFTDREGRSVFEREIGTDESAGRRHRHEGSRHYEITLLARDGRRIPALFHATSLWDGKGRLTGSYAFVTDLTEIRRQERELRLTRHAVDHSFDEIFRVGSDGRILDANRMAVAKLGYERDELLQQSVADIDPEFPRSVWPAHWEELKRKRYLRFETRHRRRDGTTFVVEMGLAYLEYEGEEYGVGIARDVTEHHRQLVELRRAATVFDHSVEGILITDPQQRIIAVNEAFTRITGYAEHEVLGLTPALLHSGLQSEAFYQSMWHDLHSQGVWQGEVWNRRKSGEIYPEWLTISEVRDESGDLINYVGVFADMTQAHQAQEELTFRAYHDQLTGLPNRLLFHERLEHAIAGLEHRRRHLAIVMLDLVGFGAINDGLGAEAGDAVLIEVGRRLEAALRATDTVARAGADEFWLLLEDLGRRNDVERVLQGVLTDLREPFTTAGQTVRPTARIGAALAPDDGTEAGELLSHAAIALHRAEQEGAEEVQYFRTEMHEEVRRRVRVEEALKVAIDQDELRVWYQPIVDLATGSPVAAEALVRWEHPDWGLMSPAEFIPLAEETGLVVPLGTWVLERALHECSRWRARGLPLRRVAVNVAAAQLRSPELYETVSSALARAGLPGECLELEITEQGFLGDVDAAVDTVARLAGLGTRIAIDDFGTGYSSLAYLKRLPIATVKIDKTFVDGLPDDEHDRSIVEAVLAVAGALELDTVAEGVEQPGQAAWLIERGVGLAQGYLYARPRPMSELRGWLESVSGATRT